MRLKNIKLAGFKSFVDPTTVSFPSNLCAIVGPNGCGKSNIIDAVRWVMGESSAKHLRGESMADVIFSGSNSRKPVGQASIELVFDNSDATLKGEYAGFSEIGIKRKVTRDGQNNYYLNGTKCRRRDIVDIFLGTGLGPRSYSIIEQGMISRLIEAKPEELRVYIEEAAGISKYKERRRDTENRMRRTKENLERLTDIREELDRQLARLERQAKAAEKYAEYKQEERGLKAQLNALRYRLLDNEASSQNQEIQQRELSIESLVTQHVGLDTAIEKHRTAFTEQSDSFNEIQGRFYGVGTEIARIEQSIHHIQERNRQLSDDLSQAEQESQQTKEHLEADQQKSENWKIEIAEIEPELETLQASESDSGAELEAAEEAMQNWQQQWDEFNQRAEEPRQKAEVEQSRIQHLEQVQTRLLERIQRLQAESEESGGDNEQDDEIPLLTAAIEQLQLDREGLEQQALGLSEQVVSDRERISGEESRLNELRSELQSARGRHASLEALQQAAAAGDKKLDQWLQSQQLSEQPRLLSQIQVEPQWQKAVELVLGDALQAVCVDGLDKVSHLLDSLEQGNLILVDSESASASANSAHPTLASKVGGSQAMPLLASVYAVDSLTDALALRANLAAHESVVTSDGLWFGPNWLRVRREADEEAGVLARQEELDQLSQQIETLTAEVDELSENLRDHRESLKDKEQQRDHLGRELDDFNKRYHQQQSQLDGLQVRMEQQAQRRQKLSADISEAKEQMQAESEQLNQSRKVLEEAIAAMEVDTEEKERLLTQRDELRRRLDDSRQRSRHDKDRLHALAMRHQSIKTQLQSILESMQRSQEQLTRLQERREQLQSTLGDGDDPTEEYQEQLEVLLEKRIGVEEELTTARQKMEQVEQELRDSEQQRSGVDQQLQGLREQLTEMRVAAQTTQVQRQALAKQVADDGNDLQSLLAELAEDATEQPFEEELEKIHNRITRLGAINLAAIDEFKIESERKQYLDAQDKDLREALETLENAIIKIDKETRTRFKETFDQINTGIQELFPKVFGGGHAYLELTGDDILYSP